MEIKTIIEAVDDWGISEPDRIAYQADEMHTFGELKQASDALAYYLEEKVEGDGPIVVFCRISRNCQIWSCLFAN